MTIVTMIGQMENNKINKILKIIDASPGVIVISEHVNIEVFDENTNLSIISGIVVNKPNEIAIEI